MDEHGEALLADLRFHYGISLEDTIAGTGVAPAIVLAYIARLPDTSLFVANLRGGRHLFGWGTDRVLQADLFNALQLNTEVTAQAKQGSLDRWSMPSQAPTEDAPKKRVSVKSLWQKLQSK